jgi:hypothetical protein
VKLKFNPFTANFEYVSETISNEKVLTRGEVITSILIDRTEDPSREYANLDIAFDEDSILYSDDDFEL